MYSRRIAIIKNIQKLIESGEAADIAVRKIEEKRNAFSLSLSKLNEKLRQEQN